jgi:hypothetical protein
MNLVKYLFSKKYRKQFAIPSVRCSCGKYDKCIRKVRVTNKGYFGIDTLYVRNQDHFRCGKVQKQIKQMKAFFKLYN